jgi:thymidylate synthase (FAD)
MGNTMHDRFCWNVMSARYSIMPKEKWMSNGNWRGPSSSNKQAGDKPLDLNTQNAADEIQKKSYSYSEDSYQRLLSIGACREQARSVLPAGQYTESFVTASLGDWMLFLRARMDSHAQEEIREYGRSVYKILEDKFPVAMKAFVDYQLESASFSRMELSLLQDILIKNIKIFELDSLERVKLLERHGLTTKRERIEFFKKIK